MEYTVLGRTGLRVSRVGCGGGGIGQVWGLTTEAESVRAIHRALELGVNFFHGRDRDPVPRRRSVEPAGRPPHPTRDPPGARCGPCPNIGLPSGRSYPHPVAGGDGILSDEPGHRHHRAWREKCGGDGRIGEMCRPAPDSTAASHALTGTLRSWLPRLKHASMGHRATAEWCAIAAHAGVVSVLYYPLSPR